MCGFYGRVTQKGKTVDLTGVQINRILDLLRPRGPDGEKTVRPAPFAYLAQTRLAVLDLHPRSLPPLTNGKNRFWLCYNGELYNYKALRKELQKTGTIFTTKSDTEVVFEALAAVNFRNKLTQIF